MSLRVPSQVTGCELSTSVSGVTGVPPEFFYLTIGGRIVGGQDLLGSSGAFPRIHIQMNGRLRTKLARPPAALLPGQCTCCVCGWHGGLLAGQDNVTGALRAKLGSKISILEQQFAKLNQTLEPASGRTP